MKTIRTLFITLIILSMACVASPYAEAKTPKEAVASTVDSVLEVLRDDGLSQPDKKSERRSRIRELIKDRFDFREMSRRSLAKHWKKRSPEEIKEFVGIFGDLLIASYIGKIENYSDEKVTYGKEVIKGKGKYGVVSTTIITKDVDIPIDYKLRLRNDKWWVYDVIVEGVSFISTYRSQYNKVIDRESYAKLIKKMKKKLDEVNAL